MILKTPPIYDDYEPAGVELPKIKLSEKELSEIDKSLNKGSSTFDILRGLARKGVKERGLMNSPRKKEYLERAKFELDTLEELGFSDYILLNWDVINFCHVNNIPTGAGRGSAAGSLVLYLLGVTNIDPIPHNLFFERFVSKTRAKKVFDVRKKEFLVGDLLPDIDSDISYEDRKRVIEYIEKKHEGRTAKILTFNTFSSKLCIKEATKYFDEATEEQSGAVSDMVPKKHGKVASLKDSEEEGGKFASWVAKHPKTYENALKIEGYIKNSGVHPSGIAICSQDISKVCPLQKTKDGELVTAYSMNDVADLMVKFDILGLRTLTIAHKACKKIGIEIEDIDENDPFIYETLQNFNHPVGLFQISADTNFRVCQDVMPKNIDELSDVVALARPGALQFVEEYINQKNDPTPLDMHEELDQILSWSKNVILYQEQLMQIANKVFGFSLEEAEILRRIVGKKKADQMPEWEEKIREAGRKLGLDESIAGYYWSALGASADYSFNKSHSFSYANLAAKTVYLKYKYPQEFFLSVLETAEFEPEPLEVINHVNEELGDFGIKLLQPSLFKSSINFKIEGKDIRYGLNSIKGVSIAALEKLVDFRGMSFENKYEVFLAAKECKISISILSALIQAGAMDQGSSSRSRMVLEARSFNLLTDREKRNFCKIGERYDYDILNSISDVLKKQTLGDDGRPIMAEKRFNTFNRDYTKHKKIYYENTKHEQFTHWWYENSLLGYSYSNSLIDCFSSQYDNLVNLRQIEGLTRNDSFKCVCQVKDFGTRISQNQNRYLHIDASDNIGSSRFMMMDQENDNKLSRFLSCNKLKKGDIIVVSGSRGEGAGFSFLNSIKIIETKVFMQIRDIKNDINTTNKKNS